jgi:ParB family chromosome partitioning protein
MGKLDDLKRTAGDNVRDSAGADRGNSPAPSAISPPARWRGVTRLKDAASIPVDMIIGDPDQPREDFDPEALGRLADSLRIRGQLQPVRVRWDEERALYVILVGERRLRAAKLAGLRELLCVIVEGQIPAGERLMIQLVENALREDLRPVEQAKAYKLLIETNGWSGNQLAKELHIGQASVVRALSLLELPASVQARIEAGDLAATVAHEIARLPGPDLQAEVASAVVEQNLTRGEVEEIVKAVRSRRPAPLARPEPVTLDLGEGVVVTVKWRKSGSMTVQQALRRALRLIQDRERSEEQAA